MTKTDVTKFFQSVKGTIVKHSPEILTGIGISGMVTSTVLAVKATPKALQLIEEAKQEKQVDALTPIETVEVAWKPYIPAAVTAAASITCLIGACSVSTNRNAALAAAYAVSESTLREYREKVVEEIGEKKERIIRDKVAQDRMEHNVPTASTVRSVGSGDDLCYETYANQYFPSSISKIKSAVNRLNARMLGGEMYISLNDLYCELGVDTSKVGNEVGWRADWGIIEVDYRSIITDDDQQCIVLDFINPPRYGYSSLY